MNGLSGACIPNSYSNHNTYVNIHKATNGYVLTVQDKEFVFTTFDELVTFLKNIYNELTP